MTVEASTTPEPTTNPFEGLDVHSTSEELALAEMWQGLIDTEPDPGSAPDPDIANSHRLLTYQFESTVEHLATYYPDYLPKSSEPGISLRLSQERADLASMPGLGKADFDPEFIIGKRAGEARWRLAGIDPSTLTHEQRETMASLWSEGAENLRVAELARLEAARTKLVAEDYLLKITTGSGIEDYKQQLSALYSQRN